MLVDLGDAEKEDFYLSVQNDKDSVDGYQRALEVLKPLAEGLNSDESHTAAAAAQGVGSNLNSPGAGQTTEAYKG